MLKLVIPARELFDEEKGQFYTSKEQVISLEHSLVSLAKWESKWGKPFLTKQEKSFSEEIDYIKCMTITQNVDDLVYNSIDTNVLEQIRKYMEAPMTATWFREEKGSASNEIITAEIIYYWMIKLGIPFECQKWHLNRLFTLIRVCSIKEAPQKKMSKKDVFARNRELNNARRKALGTSG